MNTHRQIFDKVKEHLLKQGNKAVGDNGKCVYKASTGMKCAVGCLITDEHYYNRLETQPATNEAVCNAVRSSNKGLRITEKFKSLLYELQTTHDNIPSPSWENHLQLVEKRYFKQAKHA